MKKLKFISLMLVGLMAVSCSTTYDHTGRPVQSVDPVMATAGIAAAGLIGYQVSKNRYKDDRNHNYHNHYHQSSPRPNYRPHPGYGHGYGGGYGSHRGGYGQLMGRY